MEIVTVNHVLGLQHGPQRPVLHREAALRKAWDFAEIAKLLDILAYDILEMAVLAAAISSIRKNHPK